MQTIPHSILPYDGEALYYPQCESLIREDLFHVLQASLDWKSDIITMFGKVHVMRRKSAWYGDSGAIYSYGGISREPLPWTSELLSIKKQCEHLAGTRFNSVLCNLYHDGNDAMGWHADDEKELGHEPIIASVSFGAERPFAFKHRTTKERIMVQLRHSSILIMQGQSQHAWMHSLPKRSKVQEPRINLTFRNILM
ncbi:MAG: alpha-ketoglutarate-dependent dioxygenase AlkB family protein [bacterium]